jgi:hypothetical protein
LNPLLQFLDEMERVVSSLAGGRLSQALVPGPTLRCGTVNSPVQCSAVQCSGVQPVCPPRRELETVEGSLPANFSLLYPSAESLWPYYSVLATSIYFSKVAGSTGRI